MPSKRVPFHAAALRSGARPYRQMAATIALIAVTVLGGCASLRREDFHPAQAAAAFPPGFPHVRVEVDGLEEVATLERAVLNAPTSHQGFGILALSGGGADGAYGAGELVGWSVRGKRPTFQMVSGASVGALVSPFAFLGPSWDPQLRAAFTTVGAHQFLVSRGLRSLFTPGFYSDRPLTRLVDSFATPEMLEAVAREYAKGRRLYVLTTNLDTERTVMWDMGAIASHGGPDALNLFKQVLVASASIPGVFPPQMIDVVQGAFKFREMHVDGSTLTPFLSIPEPVLMGEMPGLQRSHSHLYVLADLPIQPEFSITPLSTLSIFSRAAEATAKALTRSDLVAAAFFCRQHGVAFSVSYPPVGLAGSTMDFSEKHLRRLFEAGYRSAVAGKAWQDMLPAAPTVGQPMNADAPPQTDVEAAKPK
jgi:hypothetical protein